MRKAPGSSTLVAAAIAGAVAVMSAPPAVAADQPEHVRVVNTAHRGAMGYAPENTLAAFRLGVEQGSDLAEADGQWPAKAESRGRDRFPNRPIGGS